MKLFSKYNRINVASTVIIFLLGSIAFAILLRYVIINQVDEDLKIEKNEVLTYINRFNHLPSVIEVNDQYTTYTPINKPTDKKGKVYNKEVYNRYEHEKELHRTIEFPINVNNSWYCVSVSKSLEGTDDLIQTIIAITVTIILLILAATFLINRIVLRKLWKPFYSTLQTMQQFNINSSEKLNFNVTQIEEFTYLNTILNNALSKAQHDYQTLKEFTENASHELQTPLAVIQSKLDILIQNEKLSEAESQAIQGAYNSLQSLSRLNQSLLLLTKIENKQFNKQSDIDIKKLLEDKINQFRELWKARNIQTDINLSPATIKGNTHLIEILFNNLLSNATKHNITNGSIQLLLNISLQIINAGNNQPLDEKQLYKRFSKQNSASENHGLGLSIIQQICIASNFTCTYNFILPNKHSFIIIWK